MFSFRFLSLVLMAVLMTTAATAGEFHTERAVVYADPNGKQLEMTLYIPDDAGSNLRPGMIAIHGGGWIMGTRYQQAWFCRHFAENGYVVMTIDYRLMPKYAFPSCLEDCKSGVRWMRLNATKYRIDPNRIVAFGASAGGHLSAFLATSQPEDGFDGKGNPGASSEVEAAISLYGAVDLTMYRDHPLPGPLVQMMYPILKDFAQRTSDEAIGKALKDASPITYVRKSSKPILFVHGTHDHLVQFEQSQRFYDRLKSLGVPTKLIAVPGRGHGFDAFHPLARRKVFKQMLDFLKDY